MPTDTPQSISARTAPKYLPNDSPLARSCASRIAISIAAFTRRMSRSDWTPNEVSNGATSGMPMRVSSTASSLIGLAYRRQRAEPVDLVGGQVEVRRGDVLLHLIHAGRAGDGHHVGLSDQPGQRHLRRCGAVLRGDLAKSFHQRAHP